MKKIILLIQTIICLYISGASAQDYQKLAQTGMQFLSVVSDAKAASMAEAMTSLQLGSSSLFFNPAGMADMDNIIDLTLSKNTWIADINHYTFSIAYKPLGGQLGVFGLSFQNVDYGDFIGTVVDHNPNSKKGYKDTGIFTLSSYAAGLGYAKQITDKFSVGGQVRYAHQDLGNSVIFTEIIDIVENEVVVGQDTITSDVSNELSPFIFDFGTQYKTGIKSLVFGMSVRNFSREIKYVKEGFQAPLVFNIGVSMDLMDLMEPSFFNQKLLLSIDANHLQDKEEQIKIGLQYEMFEVLALRTGYITGEDLNGISYGLGISKLGFAFDYSYTPTDLFENVQRLTARFTF